MLLVLASGLYRLMARRMRAAKTPRHGKSSAMLSICRPTSPSPQPKSPCDSIAVPIFPLFFHQVSSISPLKSCGGTADPPAHSIAVPMVVTAGSRNTRFQAACSALRGPDLHRLIAPVLLGAFGNPGYFNVR